MTTFPFRYVRMFPALLCLCVRFLVHRLAFVERARENKGFVMQEATVFTMGGAGAASTTTIRSLLIPDDDAIASDENQSRGLCAWTSVRR